MADETAKTSLIFDASGAQKGAAEFIAAGQKILEALASVQAAADKSANAVGEAEIKKAAARTRGAKASKDAAAIEAAAAQAGADAFVAATDRVSKATSTQMAALDRYAKMWDPFVNATARAGRQLDAVWDIAQKTTGAAQQRAMSLMPEAINRMNQALRNQAAGFDVTQRSSQLTARFDPETSSARAMVAELKDLNDARKLEIVVGDAFLAQQQKIIESYDEGAQAAKRATQAQREMIEQTRAQQNAVNAQQAFNQQLGVGQSAGTVGGRDITGVKSAADSAAVFKEQFEAEEKLAAEQKKIADLRAQQNAGTAQHAFNQQLGVGGEVKSAAASAAVFQEQFEAEEKLAAERQALTAKFDPLTLASQRYAATLSQIQRAEDLNVVSTAKANELRTKETASYGKGATDAQAAAKYLGNFGDSAFGARFATQQLGIQTVQFFSSLQAGQPFMQAFIGQAHQVVDVALATGTGFRTITNAIKGWITGLAGWVVANPIVTGAIAAVAALGTLGLMAESTNRRLSTLRIQLSGTREDYQQASVKAEENAKFLARTTALTTAQSRTAAQTLAANPSFNGTQTQVSQIALAFARLSQQLGETEPDFKRMGDAMKDPLKVMEELRDKGITAIDAGMLRAAKSFMDAGEPAKAFGLLMDALVRQTANVASNLSPIQKALNELSKEFTSAAQGGRSMADLIGGIVDTAAVAGIKTLTELVKEFKTIYDLLKDLADKAGLSGGGANDLLKDFFNMLDLGKLAGTVAGGIRNIFDNGTRDWLKQQAAAPGVERTSVSSAGALGTMQLMPGTARDLGVNPFIQSENIRGGLKYIQQLSKDLANAPVGGSLEERVSRAYNVGEHGNLLGSAASTYAEQVEKADSSKLPTETASSIETQGRSLGLSTQLIDLAKRIAMVENRGQQGPVNAASRYVDPSKGGEILTGAPGTEVSTAGGGAGGSTHGLEPQTYKQQILDAQKLREQQNLLIDTQKVLHDQLTKLEAARKAAFDKGDREEVEKLDQQIQKINGDIYTTVSAQEQLARQMQNQAKLANVLTEGDAKRAAVIQQLNELNKQHPDSASAANDARVLAAALEEQNGEYRKLTFSIGLQISEQSALVEAYGKGYDSVVHATAANKALIDSMKLFPLGSDEQKAAALALTKQYEDLAIAEQRVAAAQQHATNRDTIANLNAEIDALGMDSLERERYLAHFKEELELKKQFPSLSAAERAALLQENDAIVAQQQALQVHKAAIDQLTGGLTQAFDELGNAITQSFVQGTGAAVNWANVTKGLIQQVVGMLFKMAILNPALNALFPSGQHRPTLDEALISPSKTQLAANDNSLLGQAKDKIAQLTGTEGTGKGPTGPNLPIDPTVNAMRVTVVGGIGDLGGGGGSGGGTGIANQAAGAANAAEDATASTASATQEVGTAGSGGGGLFSWLGKQASGAWDWAKGLFGGGSSAGGSSAGGGSSGDGFLSKIGGLLKNFPGGLLNSVFGNKFYEGGGLIGSMFGGDKGVPGAPDLKTSDTTQFPSGYITPPMPPDIQPPDISADAPAEAAHAGGLVGVDQFRRHSPLHPAAWMGAQRFHSGLNSDEFAAVLQRGERVLTANQNTKMENIISHALPQAGGAGAAALSRMMSGMGGSANQNQRGDVTNNNGHTINVHVPGGMSSDDARRTGYQVGAAVASRLQRVAQRNQP